MDQYGPGKGPQLLIDIECMRSSMGQETSLCTNRCIGSNRTEVGQLDLGCVLTDVHGSNRTEVGQLDLGCVLTDVHGSSGTEVVQLDLGCILTDVLVLIGQKWASWTWGVY